MKHFAWLFFLIIFNIYKLSGQSAYQKLIPIGNGFTNYGYGSLFKIIETANHDYIIASTCLTNQGNNQKTLSVARVDSTSNVIWKKHYNHFATDDRYTDFTELPDSSLIFTGFSNAGTILTRIDKSGGFLYSKLIPFSNDLIMAYKIHLLNDSSLIITGRTEKPGSNIRGNGFIITDFNGNVTNGFLYVLNNRQSQTKGTSVLSTDDKIVSCYALRVLSTPSTTQRFIPGIYKADLSGNIIWSHQFDDGVMTFDPNPTSFSLTELSDGGFLVTGDYQNPNTLPIIIKSLLIKVDSTGQLVWSKTLSNRMRSQSVLALDSGRFIFAGTVYSPQGNSRPCFIKMNSDGTVISAYYTDSIGVIFNYLNSTIIDSFGSIVSINTTFSYNNYFLSKKDTVNTTGCLDFSFSVIDSVILLTDTVGALGYSMTYTLSSFSTIVESDSTTSSWICNPTSISEIISDQDLVSLYPNPSKGQIHVFVPDLKQNGKIFIFNSCGIKIYNGDIHFDKSNSIDLSNQSSGMYYARIYIGDRCLNKKLVILKE